MPDSSSFSSSADPNPGISFFSKDSIVYAIDSGEVVGVVPIEDMIAVIVKGKDLFFTYSNLHFTSLKKKDTIKDGQPIGVAAFKDGSENKLYSLDIIISNTKGDLILLKTNFIYR